MNFLIYKKNSKDKTPEGAATLMILSMRIFGIKKVQSEYREINLLIMPLVTNCKNQILLNPINEKEESLSTLDSHKECLNSLLNNTKILNLH